jgi:hypothetical protein
MKPGPEVGQNLSFELAKSAGLRLRMSLTAPVRIERPVHPMIE